MYMQVLLQFPALGELAADNIKKCGDYFISLVEGNLQSVSTELVKRAYPIYNGAHLILSTVSKVSIMLMIMINLLLIFN